VSQDCLNSTFKINKRIKFYDSFMPFFSKSVNKKKGKIFRCISLPFSFSNDLRFDLGDMSKSCISKFKWIIN
jgi:hypothetical protein